MPVEINRSSGYKLSMFCIFGFAIFLKDESSISRKRVQRTENKTIPPFDLIKLYMTE
jgi:hypothetical protein